MDLTVTVQTAVRCASHLLAAIVLSFVDKRASYLLDVDDVVLEGLVAVTKWM